MKSAPIAIVGAGPVGLAMALGLARCGVRSVLVEKKDGISERSKAPAIHIRTREVLRQWALEERFLEEGLLKPSLTLHSPKPGGRALATVDFSDLEPEADRPGLLILEQGHTERLLLEAVRESGMCDVRFDTEAVGLTQTPERVILTLRDKAGIQEIDGRYAVGCDGASSFARDALGLPFEGMTYAVRPMLADVRIRDERDELPWPRTQNGRGGLTTALRLRPGLWRLIRLERGEPRLGEEVGKAELEERVAEVLGEGPFEVVWASRFRIHRRASPRFRVGRVLLAGDAAHVHSPAGGLGMNGGIQDAHNLAWKLACALRGGDVDRLLDSYAAEREAVMVETVSRYTDLLTRAFLDSPVFVREAAFALFRLLQKSPRIRRMNLRRGAMLDLEYPASPLLKASWHASGVRLPNPVLRTNRGEDVRLYDLLTGQLPAIIELGVPRAVVPDPLVKKVIRIGPEGFEDPAGVLRDLLGAKCGWVLVRPDAYVAWAKDGAEGMADDTRYALGHASRVFMTPEVERRKAR